MPLKYLRYRWFCTMLTIAACTTVSAGNLSAIWLTSKSEPQALAQFQQAWRQQREQTLEINEQLLRPGMPTLIAAPTWFVLSADDAADRALLASDYRGVIISLRAERARVANAILRAGVMAPRWSGIYADPSPAQLLQIVPALHRNIRHIGVVFDPYSVVNKNEWLSATQTRRMQLQGLYLQQGEYAERLVAMLWPRAEVLMITANSDLFSAATLDNMVLQAMRHGKTVIAGGEAAQHSGALLTLMPASDARLQQALQLCLRTLRGDKPVFETALTQHLQINQQVLRTLNIQLELNTLAQQVDFPLTLQQDDHK